MQYGLVPSEERDEVYEWIRRQLLSFAVKPGEMLSENSLSAQLKVGRPAVRDALSRLAEEGYVNVYPQRGTEVSRIVPDRVRQAVYTHIVLEQAVITELCSRKLTDQEKDTFQTVLRERTEMEETARRNKTTEVDDLHRIETVRVFRRFLLSTCGKEYACEYYRIVDCDMLRVLYLQYHIFNYKINVSSLTSWEHTVIEEKMMVENILRGEVSTACLICSNHYNSILWNMDQLRRIYPQFFAG